MPGTMMRNPNPMNPTPIMVADVLIPRDNVMTTGTVPTTARLPPTPAIAMEQSLLSNRREHYGDTPPLCNLKVPVPSLGKGRGRR